MFKTKPALSVCLLVAALPAAAANIYVKAGESLQVALNIALPGDVITLQAGATFSGNFTLPNKNGSGTIRIESSALANLPNDRVKPSDAVNMPKIVTLTGSPAITAAPGAHDYVLAGLEVTAAPGIYTLGMVQLGWGTERTLAEIPYNITVERCYVHGDPATGGKRGIALNSRSTIVRQSWVSDFKSTWQDTQAVGGFNGPGPFQILDNQLESTGENVMFGGAKTALPGVIPSDIVIRGNTLYKPLSWRPGSSTYAGTNWLVKNHFELKAGRRVVFEGNIVENCWASGQNGGSVVFSVSTEGGFMTWNAVEDVTIQNNIFRHSGVGITIGEKDAYGGVARNFKIRNNIFEDIDHTKWGGTGAFMLLSGNVPGVVVEHNTILSTRFAVYFGYRASVGTIFRNNIATAQVCGDSLGCGAAVFTALGTSASFAGNVMAAVSNAGWPAGNYFPATIDAIRFVNRAASNFALATDSLYVKKATDGTDPGVNIQTLQAALNGSAAAPPAQTTVSVAVTPGSVTLNANRSVALQATVSGTTNTSVQWRLDAPIGSVTSAGTYTAPSTVTARQTVRVVATSVADTSKSGASTITIDPAPAGGVTISPATKSLLFGQPVALWPTVTGVYDQRVQWSAPAIGTMNTATTGMTTYTYSASPTGTQSNIVTVTARSIASPTKSGTATFTLVRPRVIISMSDSTTFRPRMMKYITGTVYDVWEAKYRGITWTLTPNIGVFDSARGTYTAPATITAPTSVVLKAASVVDPRVSHSITLNLIP